LPFELARIALRSDAGAVAMTIAGIVMAWFILNAVFATAARMVWALARDNALIFSGSLGHINSSLDTPVASTLTVWTVLSLCGVLIVASETGQSS